MTTEPANRAAAAPASVVSTSLRRPRWLRALPVLVLLVAIGGHAALMATVNVDRQSGSGFAMFSSVDFASSRSLVVTATFEDRSVEVLLPQSLETRIDRLLYAPTDDGAAELASELSTKTWSAQGDKVVVGDTTALQGITVVVRGLTADGYELGSQILAHGTAE